MASHAEPMDVDSEFDNKENSYHHSNVLPSTEKGYEELDVSELNMKLRYSITPANSPMSRSYTANSVAPNTNSNDNANLTRSLNANVNKNDSVVKSLKALPLQSVPPDCGDNRSTTVLRPLDATLSENVNSTIIINHPDDIDENLSLPSTSSSTIQTPEATTPTKDIPKNEEGSPIMRGLKTVLNMFRSSQSPIPPAECDGVVKTDLSPVESVKPENSQVVLASTPISTHRKKEDSPSKKCSPLKESIVFNDDLEKELQWKDETTILFSQERIPIHKLFFQNVPPNNTKLNIGNTAQKTEKDLDSTVEYMDISYNDSILQDKTMCETQADIIRNESTLAAESDSEFVDCETTFTKDEAQTVVDDKISPEIDETQDHIKDDSKKENSSKLKQIILNTTQDILDATLSITPNDLNDDSFNKTTDMNEIVSTNCDVTYMKLENNSNEFLTAPLDVTKTSVATQHMTEQNMILVVHDHLPTEPQDIPTHVKLDSVSETTLIKTDVHAMLEDHELNKVAENEIIPNCQLELHGNLPASHPEGINFNDAIVNENVQDNTNKTLENDAVEKHCPDPDENISTPTDEINFNSTIVLDNFNNEVCNMNYVPENKSAEKQDLDISTNIHASNPTADRMLENVNENSLEKDTPTEELETQNLSTSTVDTVQLNTNNACKINVYIEQENTEEVGSKTSVEFPQIIEQNFQDNSKSEKDLFKGEDNNTSRIDENVCTQMKIEDVANLEKNNSITEHEFAIEQCEFNTTEDISTKAESTTVCDDKSPIKKEICVSSNALPSDVPLPEDDDIEKEILAASLPLDIVDNINIQSVNLVTPEDEAPNLCENNLEIVSNSSPIVADIGMQKPTQDLTVKQEIYSVEVSTIKSESTHTNENYSDAKNATDQLSNILNEMRESQMVQACFENNMMEESLSIQHDKEVAVHINTSKTDLNPLPDVINQTITPCQDTIITEHINKDDDNTKLKSTTINSEMSEVQSCEKDVPVLSDSLPSSVVSELKGSDLNQSGSAEKSLETITYEHDDSPMNTQAPESTEATGNVNNLSDITCKEVDLSENNSPFVYVTVEDIVAAEKSIEGGELSSESNEIVTPVQPASPPISSKGYNFNFEDMDDPFATKTKIRSSPPPSTSDNIDDLNKCVTKDLAPMATETKVNTKKEVQNRRKSQPERKRPFVPKKKFNSTFDNTADLIKSQKSDLKLSHTRNTICESRSDSTFEVADQNMTANIEACQINETIDHISDKHQETHPINESTTQTKNETNEDTLEKNSINVSDDKNSTNQKPSVDSTMFLNKDSSSIEQSENHASGTSSSEGIKSRNVFNIPEIDDMNFNPFATKTKIPQSPTPKEDHNPFNTVNKLHTSPEISLILSKKESGNPQYVDDNKLIVAGDKTEIELMEKESYTNLSNTTSSSKTTDERDATFREINTEDEDTVEGPFLELDDLNNEDKNLDFDDDVDMMHFNEIPKIKKEKNQEGEEMFIDAEAFEFLLNQNKSNIVADSGKESLFLKFDPLFAKRLSSDGVLSALNKLQRSQSTPTKLSKPTRKEETSPIAGPSNMNVTTDLYMNTSEDYNDDLNITVSKPMMVVPPAVNPAVTPRNKTITPNRSNRRSITFTSPAMAVIDRLLSLSGNNSSAPDSPVNQVSRQQSEADLALTQLRELLAEKEVHVYTLRSESKELKERLSTLESQVNELETESQGRLKKINDLNDKLIEKSKINKSMAAVVEEYERTIASLIAETEQDKKRRAEERMKLISERDEQTAHLTSMEVSFSDLHSKYEKSKQVILNLKANEDKYMKSIKEFEENLTKMQNNYELLKQHATSKLNHANQELEKINKAHEADMLKLNAMIKRKELHITSLEESLAQKTKANEELTAICDELINKVG